MAPSEVTLTGRSAILAMLGALVIMAVRYVEIVIITDGLLVAAIAADVVLAAPVRTLRAVRSGDARVRLGESVQVTTTIFNPNGRWLVARVRDAWPPSAGALPARGRVKVPAGGQASFTVTLTPARRGDCVADRVTVRSFGPLGLAGRQRSVRVPWTVRALPPFRSRLHLPGKLAMLRDLDGQHRTIRPGQGSEFDSLREYVPGDDVRSIDWRSTARRRDVMVRVWRPERDRRIVFVLDTGRTSAGRVAGYPRLDAAMDAVQLLTALATRAGDRVDLVAADRRVRARVMGPPRSAALGMITDALASVEPSLVESDGRLLASTVLAYARRRCLVVLLTDLQPSVGLLPEFRMVAARHELLVGAVSDPRLLELAAGRGSAAEVYGAAAASRALDERARVAAALGRLGATVVDTTPERLPPALADAYLSLKGAGRLLAESLTGCLTCPGLPPCRQCGLRPRRGGPVGGRSR
jgi:uncharacterized protein (DUF58 family)